MDVYKDTTSRLHGYGSVLLLLLLLLRSPPCMLLISSRLLLTCSDIFFSMGSSVLESNHEIRCVGPLMVDTIAWSNFDARAEIFSGAYEKIT